MKIKWHSPFAPLKMYACDKQFCFVNAEKRWTNQKWYSHGIECAKGIMCVRFTIKWNVTISIHTHTLLLFIYIYMIYQNKSNNNSKRSGNSKCPLFWLFYSLKIKSISLVYYNNYTVLGILIPTPSITISDNDNREHKKKKKCTQQNVNERERGGN